MARDDPISLYDSRVEELKKGIASSEALDRRRRFGANVLPEKSGRSPIVIYLSQFKNPLVYIISVAASISLLLGDYDDAMIIALVILVDSVLGFFQEYKAEKTVAALRNLLKPTARVFRDGRMVEIEAAEIVPDDIVAVNPGDRIPADGELIEAITLSVNEAILTGESESIGKGISEIIYMGTTVLSGRGLMRVTSTGIRTELGKIAESLIEIKEDPTPLQVRLEGFAKSLTKIVIIISFLIFALGIFSGIGLLDMLRISIVLAIAAIPEGLLIAVTMILVIGMRAILRRKGLVKKLVAVEALGSVSVICTDKTGTLTEGIMRVVRVDLKSEKMAANVMALCNNLADSLEVTLWNHVKTMGMDPSVISAKHQRIYEVPFTSESKYMMTASIIDGVEVSLLKGAPEIILELCDLRSLEKEKWAVEFDEWAHSGLKVLALAYKQGDKYKELMDFTWIGLVGIEDPIRPTVKDAVDLCRKAGIEVKIVTGDHQGTAEKVATTLGLNSEHSRIIEGKELEAMTQSELVKVVDGTSIFYRVAPHHKLKIVSALQSCGEVTAMIGDGVNDAPALKKANIGVSVGNATDVAKETASLILLDNNFGTLVNTVEEGRIIYENIRKVVAYVLSDSFAEICIIFGAILMGWPAPLNVAQLLWIHLICDGPSDIALGFERNEKGIMSEAPKSKKESILDKSMKFLIIVISISTAAVALSMFWYYWQIHGDITQGRTVVFTLIAVEDLIYVFSYRSLRQSIFMSGHFFANKVLFGAVTLGFLQQFLAIYVPFLNKALEVMPMELADWALVFIIAFGMTSIVEIVKYLSRRQRTIA